MSPGISTRLLATQSDERLLALVRQGHERAFEALVQRYRKQLLSYCRRLPVPDGRVEDIIQLALLKSWVTVREGAEIRDLKAWLYRVVHNTAINVARDAAHEGEPLADPALALSSDEADINLRLTAREALAEVAALPPLQREVIVRTAMVGHSHEQVASDLGISHGSVRGLLYRARASLRTAITALTPPPLLGWIAGRSAQSPGLPPPERLAELAGGGGVAGVGGLMLKSGIVAITAGTVITGAAVVHLRGSTTHRRDRDRPARVASLPAGPAGGQAASTRHAEEGRAFDSRRHPIARRNGSALGAPGTKSHAAHAGNLLALAISTPHGGGTPRSTTLPHGRAGGGTPRTGGAGQRTIPPAGSGAPPSQGSGQSPTGSSGQGTGSSTGQSGPTGTPTGNGASGTEAPPAGRGSGEGAPPGGSKPGGGSGSGGSGSGGSGTGSSNPEGSGSKGSGGKEPTSEKEPQSGSNSEHPGVVATVVNVVGNVVEHLLH